MKLARLAAPLVAVAAFIAFGVVVLSVADVGADVVLDVLHTVTPPTLPEWPPSFVIPLQAPAETAPDKQEDPFPSIPITA